MSSQKGPITIRRLTVADYRYDWQAPKATILSWNRGEIVLQDASYRVG